MKKTARWIPISITLVFVLFVIGIFGYRQQNPATISLKDNLQATDKINSVIQSGKININTASAEDLMLLPGIGKTLANRIIDYRVQHGLFRQLEELKNVSGIGNTRFDEISDFITIGQ